LSVSPGQTCSGAIHTGTAYHDYVLPGVLVLCAGFGSSLTAVAVCADMTDGIMDRFRSMDISGAAVPVATMPSWLRGFAHHQPATPVIESVRGLLMGTPVGTSGWQAPAWCGGLLAASAGLTGVLFRRRAR
jgi:hypothetical protein